MLNNKSQMLGSFELKIIVFQRLLMKAFTAIALCKSEHDSFISRPNKHFMTDDSFSIFEPRILVFRKLQLNLRLGGNQNMIASKLYLQI